MDINLIVTRDYEIKSNRTFGENKPKQTQFSDERSLPLRQAPTFAEASIFDKATMDRSADER